MDDVQIKEMVRARYGGIAAANEATCCATAPSSGCGPETSSHDKARRMGYSEAELAAVPEGANLGLGCGNPQAIAAMQPGEIVVDLGSGAGFDCFLAAQRVGDAGQVIGVASSEARNSHALAGRKAQHLHAQIGTLRDQLVAGDRVIAPVARLHRSVLLYPDSEEDFRS